MTESTSRSRFPLVLATAVVVALIIGGIWWFTSREDDTESTGSSSTPSATPTAGATDTPVTGQPTDEPGDTEILISSPADGATLDSPFTVTGKAAAFEATVEWELAKDGTVVKDGFTTAEECCTLSPYSFEVTVDPGTYTLTVRNTDPSDGEGKPPAEASREITVR